MTTPAAHIAALEILAERIDRFTIWAKTNTSVGVDVFALACAPRPRAKTSEPDKALVGLTPTELAVTLGNRSTDGDGDHDIADEVLHIESERRRRVMEQFFADGLDGLFRALDFVEGGQPESVDPRRREQMARANEQHCESCSRTKNVHGHARQVTAVGGPRNVGGLLERMMLLCRECDERVRWRAKNGLKPHLPPQAEVDAYRTTGKWPRKVA